MLRTCMSTVRVLSTSPAAISRLVRPCATSRTTSTSRRESPAVSCSAAARRPRRSSTEAPERRHLRRRLGGQRAGAERDRDPVRLAELVDRGLALADRGQRDGAAHEDLRALERDAQRAVQLGGARELRGGGVRVALGQRGLGDRARQRRERVRVAGRRAIEASASVQRAGEVEPARAREPARRTSAGPRPRSGGPGCAPSARAARGSAPRRARVALGRGQPRERGGAVALHRDDVEPRATSPGSASAAARPRRPCPRQTSIAPRMPSATSDSCGGVSGVISSRQSCCASSQSPSSRST